MKVTVDGVGKKVVFNYKKSDTMCLKLGDKVNLTKAHVCTASIVSSVLPIVSTGISSVFCVTHCVYWYQ